MTATGNYYIFKVNLSLHLV